MLYNGDEIGKSDDIYNGRAELVLVSLLCLHLPSESILVGVSRPSSCLALHCLLTTYSTNYCPSQIVYDFVLRRMFYTRQCPNNTCYSFAWTRSTRLLHKKLPNLFIQGNISTKH